MLVEVVEGECGDIIHHLSFFPVSLTSVSTSVKIVSIVNIILMLKRNAIPVIQDLLIQYTCTSL